MWKGPCRNQTLPSSRDEIYVGVKLPPLGFSRIGLQESIVRVKTCNRCEHGWMAPIYRNTQRGLNRSVTISCTHICSAWENSRGAYHFCHFGEGVQQHASWSHLLELLLLGLETQQEFCYSQVSFQHWWASRHWEFLEQCLYLSKRLWKDTINTESWYIP